jgi:polyphosphate kinase
MVNYMVNSGIDVDENAVQSMATALQKDSVSRNLEQIVKLAIDDAKAKAEEERLTKQHNPGEAKPAAAATSTGKRNASDDILSHLNTKGFQRTTFLDKA